MLLSDLENQFYLQNLKGKTKGNFWSSWKSNFFCCLFEIFCLSIFTKSLGIEKEKSIKAILKNNFVKKKDFTRFVKSKINTTKNSKIEVEILKGQESFRIKSFIKSNIWVLLPSGKSKFKKGDLVDCFFTNSPNITF